MATVVSPPSALYSSNGLGPSRIPLHTASRAATSHSYHAKKSLENLVWRTSVAQPLTNDSSDDEDLAPIKLSAEAQAILGEDNSRMEVEQEQALPNAFGAYRIHGTLDIGDSRSRGPNRTSPVAEDGSPAPRIVRASGTRPSPPRTLARDGSFMYKIHDKSTSRVGPSESITPAPSLRRIRVSGSRNETRSPPSLLKSQSSSSKERSSGRIDSHTGSENSGNDHGIVHPSTILRSRKSDEPGIHSTMRVRRIGTGTLLNGPIRRGMIRRQSEEDHEHSQHEPETEGATPEAEQSRRAKEPDLEDIPDQPPFSDGSPKHQRNIGPRIAHAGPAPSQQSPDHIKLLDYEHSPVQRFSSLVSPGGSQPESAPAQGPSASQTSAKSSSSNRKPIFKIPSLPPLESAHDQENEPPPTFKRNKASAPLLEIREDLKSKSPELKPEPAPKSQPFTHQSPFRQPLAPRSNNTPHRPAPVPPPKLSLIDVATSAGASARSKKSVHYVLNGRTYRRLDMIGRGGSSRVFRIMAENYKIFAMKRVNLEEADEAAIAGYKGEIDLLKKLENVDRVVRLFDYEVNEDKGVLSVLMEMGESDFSKMLNEQLKGENAKLDITFTRHYWKEMLDCVKAVHDYGIVHSDLKPANFLLVKGQLKLIDFGIAGAIQDNTVNVHRENQIGTPNYMSPESLVFHTPATDQAAGAKLLKVGKPSDVWSLGCILYQMTYGQPPFAHIAKQFERIMSIPNPKVEIQFPSTGVGGAVVPFGLIKTLRRCLQRDQTLRPTLEELLSDSDPFLHPVAISPDMLGRVIGNVIGYCRKREEKLREEGKLHVQDGVSILPKDDEMRGWPGAFYAKLREAGIEGTAW